MISITKHKIIIMKFFLVFSYIVCWLSISTKFNDLIPFKEVNISDNHLHYYYSYYSLIDFKHAINFLRHFSVYFCFILLIILIITFKDKVFNKKNLIYYLFLTYFFSQMPGLFLTSNSIENISYAVSSLTVIFTIILISEFFLEKEKNIFIYLTFLILTIVFLINFVPQFIRFLDGGGYLYGLYRDNAIFLDKVSPRSSGLSSTCFLILLLVYIVKENFFLKKGKIFFIVIKIFLITSIVLLQSRTTMVITLISLFFIFLYENKFSVKNFIKFFSMYLIIPLLLVSALGNYNMYKYTKAKNLDSVFSYIEEDENKLILIEEELSLFLQFSNNKTQKTLRSLDVDVSSGRFEDWNNIINTFLINKKFFIGYGSQGDRHISDYQSASNGLLYSLCSSGLFGLIFFIFFSILIFFKALKVILYSYKKNLGAYISSIIIFTILLRSILETSYAVFSIDLMIMMTALVVINNIKASTIDIKIKYSK